MTRQDRFRALLTTALIAGGSFTAQLHGAEPPDGALQSQLEQLRTQLPSQSHAMIDVEYHMSNLWFAAHERNWPLAAFYLNETRGHVQWALRLRPVRKLSSGQDLDLKPLADALETAGLAPMKEAVEKRDLKALEAGYRAALTQCYACHVAAEKPFLRPDIPHQPATSLIRMKP